MNKFKLLNTVSVLFILLISASLFYSCSEDYQTRSLAIRNNTRDTIVLHRYYSRSIQPRTNYIAPDEYEEFYNSSSEVWRGPHIELNNACDSLLLEINDIVIHFSENKTVNYCESPYQQSSRWSTKTYSYEVPKMIGTERETKFIHIFDILISCINYEE